jgi:hypothetical protein
MQHLYVRPVESWAPHYVEDTSFLACAPQANPMKDPPLHFGRDSSGNISWCAESYPSQNPNVKDLEPVPSAGDVAPFTSHVEKNSNSAQCSATTIEPYLTSMPLYSATGAGHHLSTYLQDSIPAVSGACPGGGTLNGANCEFGSSQTCDRTVQNPDLANTRFPLLAPPKLVESAIEGDSSYGCTITYDGGQGKTGKYTPTQGCCGGAVQLWSGIAPSGSTDAKLLNTSAHLEPDAPCQVPQY